MATKSTRFDGRSTQGTPTSRFRTSGKAGFVNESGGKIALLKGFGGVSHRRERRDPRAAGGIRMGARGGVERGLPMAGLEGFQPQFARRLQSASPTQQSQRRSTSRRLRP